MKREILFRGIDYESGKFRYGNLTLCENGDCIISRNPTRHEEIGGKVIPTTIGEYTGCRDANRQRIFEGDIISALDYYDRKRNITVRYSAVVYAYFGGGDQYEDVLLNDHLSDVKIIGNTYNRGNHTKSAEYRPVAHEEQDISPDKDRENGDEELGR